MGTTFDYGIITGMLLINTTVANMQQMAAFNDAAFMAALEERRQSENLSWRQLGRRLGLSPSTFSRLSRGRRPDVETLVKLIAWLDMPMSAFIIGMEDRPNGGGKDPMPAIVAALRTDSRLTDETASALEDIVRVAYNRLRGF
jgi:transcriptional regulator with XRE-family HTH domain